MSVTKVSFSMINGAFVNVLDFGAVGDGVADDAPAIEAASLALFNAGGGTLYIPAGVYKLATLSTAATSYSSYVTLRNNVSIVGAGQNATILKVASGQNTVYSSQNKPNIFATNQSGLLSNVTISDLTFDWNGLNNLLTSGMAARNNASVLTINGAENLIIQRVTVKETPGNQCFFIKNESYTTAPGGNIVIQDCRFEDCGSGLPGNYNQDHSSVYTWADDVSYVNNLFTAGQRVNGAAFELHGSRNYAAGNKSNFYALAFYAASDVQDVSDIVVRDGLHTNCSQAFSISAQTYSVDNVSVSGCTFTQSAGLTFASVTYFVNGNTIANCSRLAISDCVFTGNSYANNRFLAHYKISDFVFSNNKVFGFNDGTNGYGIFFTGVPITGQVIAKNVNISNNMFEDVLAPIYCNQANKTIEQIVINGNVMSNSSAAGAAVEITLTGTGYASGIVSSNAYGADHSAPVVTSNITEINNIQG